MIKDRVFETSTTSGTGSYTLLGAITGARSFQDAFGAGPVKVYYFAVPANADGSFECGIGTFTGPTTLERTSIIASSNSNAAVDWGTEVKNVFCAAPGELEDRLNDLVNCGTAGGTGNAITLSPNVPVAEYATNAIYIFTASATNSGPTNANVSTLGNKAVQINGAALTGGEIVSGRTYGLRYDGTALQLLFFDRIPETYAASDVTYDPGSPALVDAANVQDAIDGLAAQINAIPFTKFYESSEQSITANSLITLAHGLGAKPKLTKLFLRLKTAQGNWSIDDDLEIANGNHNGVSEHGYTLGVDATNIYVATGAAIRIINKTTGAATQVSLSDSRYIVRAWA